MLKLSIAASLLAMTLSVDAFAADKRETYETEEITTSRGLGLRPTHLENHTPRRHQVAAHVIQALGNVDPQQMPLLRAHFNQLMDADERAHVIQALGNVDPQQMPLLRAHFNQLMDADDSSFSESCVSKLRQLFWAFFQN